MIGNMNGWGERRLAFEDGAKTGHQMKEALDGRSNNDSGFGKVTSDGRNFTIVSELRFFFFAANMLHTEVSGKSGCQRQRIL